MFEWLPENWWALWLTVFLVFAVVEMITLDLFFIMLGGGALAGLVAALAGADLGLQIVAFCVVSLLMIGFVRPVALKHLHKGPADRRSNVERLIGESALVMEPVTCNRRPGQNRRRRLERPLGDRGPGTGPARDRQRDRRRHRRRRPAAGDPPSSSTRKNSGGRHRHRARGGKPPHTIARPHLGNR